MWAIPWLLQACHTSDELGHRDVGEWTTNHDGTATRARCKHCTNAWKARHATRPVGKDACQLVHILLAESSVLREWDGCHAHPPSRLRVWIHDESESVRLENFEVLHDHQLFSNW